MDTCRDRKVRGFFRNDRIVALEVNTRPPVGLTTDMFNYANDIDIYGEWADPTRRKETDGLQRMCLSRRHHDLTGIHLDPYR